MKSKKIILLIMGIICFICFAVGITNGIALGMQKAEKANRVDVKETDTKESPTNKIEHTSVTNTSLKQEKEQKDPNKAFKYTKEELTKEDEKRKLEDERDSKQSQIESNRITKKEYKEATGNVYLIESSNVEKIDISHIYNFDEELLALARNEIYARHGYIFSKPIYKEYFSDKIWYTPTKKISEIQLSEEEKYNISYLEWQEKCVKEGSSEPYNRRPQRAFCDMYRFNADEPFKMDLNNDGIEEEIIFQSKTRDEWSVGTGVIKINGKASEEITGEFQHNIWVVDIDEADNYKELVINDMGPSSDYEDSYYYYDGTQLVFMGEVTGELNSQSNAIRNYVENGILHASIRCDIIGTAWYNWDYRLTSDHKLQEIPSDYCETSWQTYTRKPITIYESNQLSSKKTKYKTGLPMLIVGTDLKEWVKVQLEDGKYGWFNTKEFNPYNLDGILYAD